MRGVAVRCGSSGGGRSSAARAFDMRHNASKQHASKQASKQASSRPSAIPRDMAKTQSRACRVRSSALSVPRLVCVMAVRPQKAAPSMSQSGQCVRRRRPSPARWGGGAGMERCVTRQRAGGGAGSTAMRCNDCQQPCGPPPPPAHTRCQAATSHGPLPETIRPLTPHCHIVFLVLRHVPPVPQPRAQAKGQVGTLRAAAHGQRRAQQRQQGGQRGRQQQRALGWLGVGVVTVHQRQAPQGHAQHQDAGNQRLCGGARGQQGGRGSGGRAGQERRPVEQGPLGGLLQQEAPTSRACMQCSSADWEPTRLCPFPPPRARGMAHLPGGGRPRI